MLAGRSEALICGRPRRFPGETEGSGIHMDCTYYYLDNCMVPGHPYSEFRPRREATEEIATTGHM